MIYTIGHKESYETYFEEQHPKGPYKLGRTDDYNGEYYPGGSVWQTYEEARLNCPKDYEVYGVEADWFEDTAVPTELNVTWHDLLKTSKLVKIL